MSIHKLESGHWQVRYRLADGRGRKKTYRLKDEAKAFERSQADARARGSLADPSAGRRTTVEDYANQWAKDRAESWARSTREKFATIIAGHIVPTFGEVPISAVTASAVQAWANTMAKSAARSTVSQRVNLLFSILKDAQLDGLLAAVPRRPVLAAGKPSTSTRGVIVLDAAQVAAAASAMPPERAVAVWLAAGAGLRVGEVLGLSVRDVEFLKRVLRVRQQATVQPGGEVTLVAPKTAASVRSVPISEALVATLAAHVARYQLGPADLFIRAADGSPLSRHRLNESWDTARDRAGLGQGVRFHALRHTYASALISAGCSVVAVQEALGHASATVTLETYSHLWPGDEDRIRAASAALVNGPAGQGLRNNRDL